MKRFLLFVLVVFLAVFGVSQWNQRRNAADRFTPATGLRVDLGKLPILAAMDEEYTRLAEAVVPSVVSLTTARTVRSNAPADPFDFFFGNRRGGRSAPREFVQNSLGSGVIVSQEGHILTNNHVVNEVDEIKVHLRDGREYPATIIGTDESTDIAVLKINAPGVVPLPLGDSDAVKVGSLVLAIGNPFGLQESVTHGMISATGRQISEDSGTEFFQTDTAINPGNSGGPLVNLRGEIIGINTAIGNYSGSGTWQGIGFAIPSNVVKRSLEAILKHGRVVRGYLGVVIQELTPDLARQLGLSSANGGALVSEVAPGSPAEKAGLKVTDIITALDGKPVRTIRDLLRTIASAPVDAEIEITLLRDGKKQKLTARLEPQPAGFRAGPPPGPVPGRPGPGLPGTPRQPGDTTEEATAGRGPLAGVEVAPIPDAHRPLLPQNVRGVMVARVPPRSPASGSLQVGDVIEEINRQPVADPAAFAQVANGLGEGSQALLFIARGRARSFLVLPPR